jgi:hypothetical protein
MSANSNVTRGMDVVSMDGESLGTVTHLRGNHFVATKDFFHKDYHIPFDAVANIGKDRVTLSLTKERALAMGWEVAPDKRGATGDSTAAEWTPANAEEAQRSSVATSTSSIDPAEKLDDQDHVGSGYTFLKDRKSPQR